MPCARATNTDGSKALLALKRRLSRCNTGTWDVRGGADDWQDVAQEEVEALTANKYPPNRDT
jgi:hypothetical protein